MENEAPILLSVELSNQAQPVDMSETLAEANQKDRKTSIDSSSNEATHVPQPSRRPKKLTKKRPTLDKVGGTKIAKPESFQDNWLSRMRRVRNGLMTQKARSIDLSRHSDETGDVTVSLNAKIHVVHDDNPSILVGGETKPITRESIADEGEDRRSNEEPALALSDTVEEHVLDLTAQV
jgi:hypothetical protein